MKCFKIYMVVAIAFISLNSIAQVSKEVDTRKIQGGMWIPSLLEGRNEEEMQLLGSKLTAKDIYDANSSSLKDAIGYFGIGCTSEIISANGLLLTNHHCGFDQIQSHSSVENDFLKNGFWAMNYEEELTNPGLAVTFMKRIEDVTSKVFEGVSENMSEVEKKKIIDQNILKVNKEVEKEEWQDSFVRSFFKGNQYFVFVTEVFKDVRLVGAPPTAIGKFGGDTDNWMWPRHTGDFSLFRVYANAANKPAEYSKDNVPYKPEHYLPISLDGVEERDFTMIYGYPAVTNEYLPSVAINQIVNVLNPAKIEVRDAALKIMNSYMRKDADIKIKYASKYASTANYWKKWIGERQGIQQTNAIDVKKEEEKEFSKIVAEKDLAGYSTILSDFEKLYKEIEQIELARDYWIEIAYRNVELMNITFKVYQLEQAYLKGGDEAFERARQQVLSSLEDIYKDYSNSVDQSVFEKLIEMYAVKSPAQFVPNNMKIKDYTALAKSIYGVSNLTSLENAKKLLSGSGKEVVEKINKDKAFAFGKELHTIFYTQIEPKFQELNLKIEAVQKNYMKALMEVFPSKRFFPDANRTLRINYGMVQGYSPKDGVTYTSKTYLKGVIEKHIEGDYEFDVPQKLQDLYHAKDYGQYGENGKMPVNILSTNHMTGGNSGSPIIDGEGNLIGLGFDTTWEGTMSDLYFDADIVRSIMVDIRYVLFIIDKYAGAKNLIDELKFVHPKKK